MTERFIKFQEKVQERVPEFIKETITGAKEAISKTEDDVRSFVGKLVERGKLTPDEGKKLLSELMGNIRDRRTKFEKKTGEFVDKTMGRINLPSKSDLDALSKRVNTLSKKVNKLKKDLA